jgi:predicted phosphatase
MRSQQSTSYSSCHSRQPSCYRDRCWKSKVVRVLKTTERRLQSKVARVIYDDRRRIGTRKMMKEIVCWDSGRKIH